MAELAALDTFRFRSWCWLRGVKSVEIQQIRRLTDDKKSDWVVEYEITLRASLERIYFRFT